MNGGHDAISEHHSLSGHLGSRRVSHFKSSARLSTAAVFGGGRSTQVPGQKGDRGRHCPEFGLHHNPSGHKGPRRKSHTESSFTKVVMTRFSTAPGHGGGVSTQVPGQKGVRGRHCPVFGLHQKPSGHRGPRRASHVTARFSATCGSGVGTGLQLPLTSWVNPPRQTDVFLVVFVQRSRGSGAYPEGHHPGLSGGCTVVIGRTGSGGDDVTTACGAAITSWRAERKSVT